MYTIVTLLTAALLGVIASGIYLHYHPLQPARARRLFKPTIITNIALFVGAQLVVTVIGGVNDIGLYRELMKRGVSEYLVPPIAPIQFMRTISGLFADPAAINLSLAIAAPGMMVIGLLLAMLALRPYRAMAEAISSSQSSQEP